MADEPVDGGTEPVGTEPVGGASSYSVSASAGITLADTAGQGVAYPASTTRSVLASTGVTLDSYGWRQVTTAPAQTYLVAASTGVTLAESNSASNTPTPQVYNLGAVTAFALADGGTAVDPPQVRSVVATTQLAVASIGTTPATLAVQAATSLALTTWSGSHRVVSGSAVSSFALATTAAGTTDSGIAVAALTGLTLTGQVAVSGKHQIFLDVANTVALGDTATVARLAVLRLSGSGMVAIADAAPVAGKRLIPVAAATRVALAGSAPVAGARHVAATTTVAVATRAADFTEKYVSAGASLALSGSAATGREIIVSATTGFGLASADDGHGPIQTAGNSVAELSDLAAVAIGYTPAGSAVALVDLATAYVFSADGTTVPGGDTNAGLRRVAVADFSGDFPATFAESAEGAVLVANGVDPMVLWDALPGQASLAGIVAPTAAPEFAGSGVGRLTGKRMAYVRYIGTDGSPSDLSPAAPLVDLGREGWIEAVAPQGGVLVLQSPGHGLLPQDAVWIEGIVPFAADGYYPTRVLDDARFAIPVATPIDPAQYVGGGSWTWGCASVVYQAAPPPNGIARRQFLRNLDGDDVALYVDLDTTDLVSVRFESTRDDDDLSTSEVVPLLGDDGLPYSMRFAVPPPSKAVVLNHQGRIFAAVDPDFAEGNVAVTLGSVQVSAVACRFRPGLVGRFLAVAGAERRFAVAAVAPNGSSLTLAEPYVGETQAYARYSIRSDAAERRAIRYSEPADPRAWHPASALAVPEDGDELAALASIGSFLYAFGARHTYKLTYQDDPGRGLLFLVAQRGVVNQRCWVQTDGSAYLLDEAGVWAFDGSGAKPASAAIDDLFTPGLSDSPWAVDWSRDRRLWHASHDPGRATIRWFVHRVGSCDLDGAICLDYRRNRWWTEQYPFPATASASVVVGGILRPMVGSSGRRVFCLGEGSADVLADALVADGTVGSATATTLFDPAANFPAAAGAPVAIVAGTGVGQSRSVAASTATILTLVEPWTTIPDATSRYRLGGVPWRWRSGWYELLAAEEDQNPRDLALLALPTQSHVTADIELYYDHHPDPEAWEGAVDEDAVTIIPGDSRISVDLAHRPGRSGYAIRRLSGHSEFYAGGAMFVSAAMSGVGTGEPVRLSRLSIAGARG